MIVIVWNFGRNRLENLSVVPSLEQQFLRRRGAPNTKKEAHPKSMGSRKQQKQKPSATYYTYYYYDVYFVAYDQKWEKLVLGT